MPRKPSKTAAGVESDNEEQDYSHLSTRKQVLCRASMYLGGTKPMQVNEYVMRKDAIHRDVIRYSPAAMKCIDEAIVNAVDQHTRNGRTNIWISIGDRRVTVRNDGGSVPVEMTRTQDGREMYKPQMVFGEYRTSSTYGTSESITGGTFGYGIKLTNTFSVVFELENLDAKRGLLYRQQWLKSRSDDDLWCGPPEITEVTKGRARDGYTQVSFELDWKEFDMDDETWRGLELFTHMRAIHSSVFMSSTTSTVSFNGKPVDITNLSQLAEQCLQPVYPEGVPPQLVKVALDGNDQPWQLVVGIKPDTERPEHITLVNGVYVRRGKHLEWLEDQIVRSLKPRVEALWKAVGLTRKFNRNIVLRYIMIFLRGHVVNPEYTGQRKDELEVPPENFKPYVIPSGKLDEIWDLLKPYLDDDIIASGPPKKRRTKVRAKKYSPAKMAGTREGALCSLFVAEGDSAVGMIEQAIASGCSKNLTHDYYGTYSIQGVPMNPRKQITTRVDSRGREVKVPNEKLKKNDRLSTLETILGLDKSRDYTADNIEKYLRYGHVIIASDQDEDGKGNIRSQTLNFFQTFWPGLVQTGYVQFINTPVIRVIPQSTKLYIEEFFTEQQYRDWVQGAGERAKRYRTKYYKGLGTHSPDDVRDMFSSWPSMLMTYISDKRSEPACEVYFGKDADKRKIVLSNPPKHEEDTYYRDEQLSVTDHLNTATRQYQLYNIARHVEHMVDGQTPSKRKILAAARMQFGHSNESMKVYQFGGVVAQQMNYHHGDASLNDTIRRMAQYYVGAREFPLLQAESNFGSRAKGGLDAAAPRYADLRMNRKLVNMLFPKLDDCNLEYVYDDGKRCEPRYYVPIVPLAILESYNSPATGWASTIWGREYTDVSKHLHRCIEAGTTLPYTGDFPVNDHRYSHTIMDLGGVPNSLGTYTETGNDSIVITELPMRVWNEHYIKGNPDDKKSTGIEDLPEIQNVYDTSSMDSIHIEIEFKRGGLDVAREKGGRTRASQKYGLDPLIAYLDLKQSLSSNLCYIGLDGAVKECSTYVECFDMWYGVRKDFYRQRVERTSVLLQLQVILLENQTRFVTARDGYDLNVPRAKQVELLGTEKYQRIDKSRLSQPDHITTADLRKAILDGDGADYGYLLKMSSEDITVEALASLQKDLDEARRDLEDLLKPDRFPGARIWKRELEQLDEAVDKYREHGNWTYDQRKPMRRRR